jgi:cell division transport system ATP-binding protein
LDMLKWLGLGDLIDARPTALSMGQRQLVSVARAVIKRPALLLCDEPINNIDGELSGQLMHLFAQLRKLGTTVILATHSEHLVERYPHPVVRVAGGRLSGPVQPASALAAAD